MLFSPFCLRVSGDTSFTHMQQFHGNMSFLTENEEIIRMRNNDIKGTNFENHSISDL